MKWEINGGITVEYEDIAHYRIYVFGQPIMTLFLRNYRQERWLDVIADELKYSKFAMYGIEVIIMGVTQDSVQLLSVFGAEFSLNKEVSKYAFLYLAISPEIHIGSNDFRVQDIYDDRLNLEFHGGIYTLWYKDFKFRDNGYTRIMFMRLLTYRESNKIPVVGEEFDFCSETFHLRKLDADSIEVTFLSQNILILTGIMNKTKDDILQMLLNNPFRLIGIRCWFTKFEKGGVYLRTFIEDKETFINKYLTFDFIRKEFKGGTVLRRGTKTYNVSVDKTGINIRCGGVLFRVDPEDLTRPLYRCGKRNLEALLKRSSKGIDVPANAVSYCGVLFNIIKRGGKLYLTLCEHIVAESTFGGRVGNGTFKKLFLDEKRPIEIDGCLFIVTKITNIGVVLKSVDLGYRLEVDFYVDYDVLVQRIKEKQKVYGIGKSRTGGSSKKLISSKNVMNDICKRPMNMFDMAVMQDRIYGDGYQTYNTESQIHDAINEYYGREMNFQLQESWY